MEDEAGPDAKVICVEPNEPRWKGVHDIGDLPHGDPGRDQALLRHLQGPRAREVLRHRRVRGPGRGVGRDPCLPGPLPDRGDGRTVSGERRAGPSAAAPTWWSSAAGIVGSGHRAGPAAGPTGLDLVVLEREASIAAHQSGHNSGVIHSGLYYRPGSRRPGCAPSARERARACCTAAGVACERCGKVVVATDRRGAAGAGHAGRAGPGQRSRGARSSTAAGLAEHEPHAAGVAALLVPATGVVDYRRSVPALAAEIVEPAADASSPGSAWPPRSTPARWRRPSRSDVGCGGPTGS